MEVYINILSARFGVLVGGLLGLLVASRLNLLLKVSKKEDYEEKSKELEALMETILEEKEEIKAKELFPPGVNKDFGIPRPLK